MKSIWIILFDTSGSMRLPLSSDVERPISRLEAAKRIFSNELLDVKGYEVALIQATDDSKIIFREKGINLRNSLDQINSLTASGVENFVSALELSLEILRSGNYSSALITILTDDGVIKLRTADSIVNTISSEFPDVEINTKLFIDSPALKSVAERISINGTVDVIKSIDDLILSVRQDRDRQSERITQVKTNLSGLGIGGNDVIIKLVIPFKNNGIQVNVLIETLDIIEQSLYRSDYQDITNFFNRLEIEYKDELREQALSALNNYQNRRFKIISTNRGSIEIIGVVLAVSAFILTVTFGKSIERAYENSKMDLYLTKIFKDLFDGKFNSVLTELRKMFITEDDKNIELSISRDAEDTLDLINIELLDDQMNEEDEVPTYDEVIKQNLE